MFYDIVNSLCKARKTTITKMSEDIGLSNAAATSWKKGAIPKASTLEKISAYFDVSVDFLLGKEDTKKPASDGDELCMSDAELLEAFRNAPEYKKDAIRDLLGLK